MNFHVLDGYLVFLSCFFFPVKRDRWSFFQLNMKLTYYLNLDAGKIIFMGQLLAMVVIVLAKQAVDVFF